MSAQTWMPHAGHFICGHMCRFRLNTHVNGYIVSTVGEYAPNHVFDRSLGPTATSQMRMRRDDDPCEEVGFERMYETMVFPAVEGIHACCPFEAVVEKQVDFAAYNDSDAAFAGHMAMLEKWGSKKTAPRKAKAVGK